MVEFVRGLGAFAVIFLLGCASVFWQSHPISGKPGRLPESVDAPILSGETATSVEKMVQPAEKADRGFVLRADKVIATEGEPVLLELTLVYTGDKPLRIDDPVCGLCQPGNGQPPWVSIAAPASWKVCQEAFRKAFPHQSNSRHGGSMTVKRGDSDTATIRLHERFSQIPLGRSTIRVTWQIYNDPFGPNSSSPYPIAEPTVTVPVTINPRIARKNPHDTEPTHRLASKPD